MRHCTRRRKSNRWLLLRKGWFKSAVLFLLTALSLALFSRWAMSHGMFDVKEVRIVGARYSDPVEILEVVAPELGSTIFANHQDAIVTLQRMPLIKAVEIDKIPPGRIVIHVAERTPIALLGGEVLRPIDEEGWILPISLSEVNGDLPVIEPSDDFTVDAIGRVGSESIRSTLRFLTRLKEMNDPLLDNISVVSVGEGGEIRFTTVDHRFSVYLDPEVSVEYYSLLQEVMKDLEGESIDGRTIDMRFEDQVVVY